MKKFGENTHEMERKSKKRLKYIPKRIDRTNVLCYDGFGATNNGRRLASNAVEIRDHLSDKSEIGNTEVLHMISAIEIIGAIASAITIFSAGVAVGRYITLKK